MLANTSASGSSRQRLSSVERREAIVRAAMDLFAQNGFRGTTTRELASAISVSEPVLYQHFTAKKDLYVAIVDLMLAEVSERFESALQTLPEEATAREFFVWLGDAVMGWYLDDTRYIRLLLFSALEGHELADIWYEKAMSQFLAFISEQLEQRMRAGELRKMEPMFAARCFVSMVAHLALVTTVFQCPLPGVSREEIVQHAVDIYLDGARNSERTSDGTGK